MLLPFIRRNFLFLNTDFVGSINTRNICLILSTIYSFISVSVCIDREKSFITKISINATNIHKQYWPIPCYVQPIHVHEV
jgi:hypothetical protein